MAETKQWRGVWFPADEQHLIGWMKKKNRVVNGKPTYQYHKYEVALNLCKKRRRAIDVGGNIGLWAMNMVHDFERVDSFEPVNEYADVFVKNAPEAVLHRVALGEQVGTVQMVKATANSCGDTRPRIDTDKDSNVIESQAQMATLDSYGFLSEVDLIKLDCEGYELHALKGGEQTILANRPVIVVEQKPGHGKSFGYKDDAAVDYLILLGMKKHAVISGDYIMAW
jgi:FkbM family methyltransferase